MVAKFENETDTQTKAIEALRDEINSLQEKLQKWQASRIRFLYRGRIRRANSRAIDLTARAEATLSNLQTARSSLQEAENARDESWLDGTFALDGPVAAAWRALESAFYNLSQSQHIWDVTAGRKKRAGEERSTATQVVERKPTALSMSPLPFFAPDFPALRWHNVNGDDLYLYPGLILVARDVSDFAVIDLNSIQMSYERTRFIEGEAPPTDAERVGSSWKYSNRDGTRDLRYRDNEEIPVMLYAEFDFKTETGLNERFMFSNVNAASAFANAMLEFENLLGRRP